MFRKLFMAATALLGIVAASDSVNATVLLPGTTVIPAATATVEPVGSTLLQTVSGSFSAATIMGTFTEQVYLNSLTNHLDFILQVTNSASSSDSIERVTIGKFANTFTTDVYYNQTGTETAPTTTNRTLTGTVGFNFPDGLGNGSIPMGGTSALLIIRTNATGTQAGTIGFIDSTTVTVNGLVAGVPEPATWSLAVGVLPFLVYGLRKARKQQS